MQKYIVGNLKMNIVNSQELERYFKVFKTEIKGKSFENTEIVICPPFVHLKDFVK